LYRPPLSGAEFRSAIRDELPRDHAAKRARPVGLQRQSREFTPCPPASARRSTAGAAPRAHRAAGDQPSVL